MNNNRFVYFDYLKVATILLVVFHHAVMAYTLLVQNSHGSYLFYMSPVINHQEQWLGFDYIVGLDDVYFMALMFFVSGIFSWNSLLKKGGSRYLVERSKRLALPFVVTVLLVMPVAYYYGYLASGGQENYANYFLHYVTDNGLIIPPGPAWFIWILFLYNLLLVLIRALWPTFAEQTYRLLLWLRPEQRTYPFALALLLGFAICYYPAVWLFGVYGWFNALGPVFWVQKSRFLLYFAFFLLGVALGSRETQQEYFFAPTSQLIRHWWLWLLLALCIYWTWARQLGSAANLLSGLGKPAYLLMFPLVCSTAIFGLIGLFRLYINGPNRIMSSLANNAFGIYLLHYPFVTAAQYWLLNVDGHAITLGLLTFVLALLSSWLLSVLLRCLPGVKNYL